MTRSVALVTGVDAVEPAHWNALRGTQFPFMQHAFLHALETSGSVGEGSGWNPRHLLLREGERLLAAMPCYAKTHSYGEYVFDWSWADAYNRHRVPYYPKLLSAVPFTPATGPRVLVAEGVELREALEALLPALRDACERRYSSWHLLFPEPALAAACAELGLLRRTGVQYHWQNRAYACFEDFLARFASRKRKQLKKERRQVAEQGLEIRRLRGAQIDAAMWERFYVFYQMTYARRSGHGGYLSREFFHAIGETMPENLLLVVALRDGEPVAGALNLIGDDTLYGRYWGCIEDYAQLHFELCYYQGIEFCIEQGLTRFDAGAQGEHKLARGFEPVITESFHHIAHEGFREAIADFLRRECISIESYRQEATASLPFRKDGED